MNYLKLKSDLRYTDSAKNDEFYYKNYILKKAELTAFGLGIVVDITSGEMTSFNEFNPLQDDGEHCKKSFLKCRIFLIEQYSDRYANYIRYPIDFERRHYKAKFRTHCIKEYERVLDQVLEIVTNEEKQKELLADYHLTNYYGKVTSTSQKFDRILCTYLDNLISLYLNEYCFESVKPLIEFAAKFGLLNSLFHYSKYYIKTNQVEVGCKFLKKTIEEYNSLGYEVDSIQHLLNGLEYVAKKKQKPYKPKPRKHPTPTNDEIIKFEGKFPWEK